MAKVKERSGISFIISLILHVIFFALLFITMSHTVQPPVIVSLAKDPNPEQKIVKATIIDKRAVDQAIQRQAAEDQQKQDDLLAQQRKTEQLKQEAILAKEALELANMQKVQVEAAAKKAVQEKAKLEQQQLQVKKQIEQQQNQAKKELAKKELAKQELAKQESAKQQAAAKKTEALRAQQAQQAAALKAQQDRIAAEHLASLASEVEQYRYAIQSAIEDNRILSSVFAGDIKCKIRIKLLPDGSILSVKVVESSGNPAYDEMSIAAVYKSVPFPMPPEQELYNQLRDIILSFENGEQAADVL